MLARLLRCKAGRVHIAVRVCSGATQQSGFQEALQGLQDLPNAHSAEDEFLVVRGQDFEAAAKRTDDRGHGGAASREGDTVVESTRREVQLIEGRSKLDMSQKERLILREFRKFTNGVNARTSWYKQCTKEELDRMANNLLFYIDNMGERSLTWSIYEFAKLGHRNDKVLTVLGERLTDKKRLGTVSRQNLCYTLFGFAQLGYNNMEIVGKLVKQLVTPELMYNYRKDQLLMIAASLYRMKWSDVDDLTIIARECNVRREQGKFKVNKQVAWLLDTTGVAKSHFATRRKVVLD